MTEAAVVAAEHPPALVDAEQALEVALRIEIDRVVERVGQHPGGILLDLVGPAGPRDDQINPGAQPGVLPGEKNPGREIGPKVVWQAIEPIIYQLLEELHEDPFLDAWLDKLDKESLILILKY